MTWDGARERIVLTGWASSSALTTETWEYDGVRWEQRVAGGPRLATAGQAPLTLTWHGGREHVVTMLGRATWLYETPYPAIAEAFGAGCPTSVGPLVATPDGRPWSGDRFAIDVASLPQASSAFLVFGTSDRVFGGVALPWSLAPFGAPGCALYTDVALVAGLAAGAPSRTWSAAIPPDPTLVTLPLFAQAVTFDPAANALGVALSNGLRLQVGIR